LRETGWPPAADVPDGRRGDEYRNASGDLHDAVARFSLATGAAAVSAYGAVAPLMQAKRWPFWPPSLITTDGVHGDMFRLTAASELGECCISLEQPTSSRREQEEEGIKGEGEGEGELSEHHEREECEYCASPPASEEIFRREEWGSPWTEDVVDDAHDEAKARGIYMSFYNIVLADMMLFPIFQARLKPRGAFFNDASWEEKPKDDVTHASSADDRNKSKKRGDPLRCLRWDHPAGSLAVLMVKNIHRRPPASSSSSAISADGDDAVPERYLGNESELVAAWPGGNPDAPDAKGWIFVVHPLDGPPTVREAHKHGLVSVRVGDFALMEFDASTIVGGAGEAEIEYLASYEHMGVARLSCESGCECEPQVLNGTIVDKVSRAVSQSFELRDGGDLAKCRLVGRGCAVTVPSLNDTVDPL
jgi:hypothetical protein